MSTSRKFLRGLLESEEGKVRRLRFRLAVLLIRPEIQAEERWVLKNYELEGPLTATRERYWMGRLTAMRSLRQGRLGEEVLT